MSHSVAAFLLAGGKGTRLERLTNRTAKPAVPFAGGYRLIDFTLSNLSHSAINQVAMLTQYEAESLHHYVKNGAQWGLQLSSLMSAKGGYTGTADAVYEHLHLFKQHDYILIVSGDHIYETDYSEFISQHIRTGADATIALTNVSPKDAHRFGIAELSSSGRMLDFNEKPIQPKSELASMGVYLFNRVYLEKVLAEDAKTPHSSHDFGKDIIPKMLTEQALLFGYCFTGYWRDVGTVESYFLAHMDKWEDMNSPFYKQSHAIINGDATVLNDPFIQKRHTWKHRISHSVVDSTVKLGMHVNIKKSLLLKDALIGHSVSLHNIIVPPETHIPNNTILIRSKPTIFHPSMLQQTKSESGLNERVL